MKKKRMAVFSIIILILLIVVLFFTFRFSKRCYAKECFNDALLNCKKASYIDDSEYATWKYKIEGENVVLKQIRKILKINKENCGVNVKLLQVKEGNVELEKGAGLDMDCEIPYGIVMNPQSDISKCHGLLREFLQEQIIQKLHKYIVENLGEIGEELETIYTS